MDGTLTLIFAKSETTWDITTKVFSIFTTKKEMIFFPNLKGVAQKMGLVPPLEV